jgi:hypothetical protein
MAILLVLILAGGAFYLTWTRRQHRTAPDVGWSSLSGPVLTGDGPGGGPAATPVIAHPDSMQVATALSRIEGLRLLVSPLMIVGYLLSLLAAAFLLDSSLVDEAEWLGFVLSRVPLMIFPFCGMLLLAANRAVLRGRRDGVEELYSSLPAPRSARSSGHLLSLWMPTVVGIAIVALLLLAAVASSGKTDEPMFSFGPRAGAIPWSNLLAYGASAVVLVMCAGALGIALARLVPYSLAAVASLPVIVVFTGSATGGSSDLARSLAPFTYPRALPDLVSVEVPWPHVVYLLGLGLVAVAATWLLDGDRRRGLTALGVAAVLVVVGWAAPVVFPDEARFDSVAAVVSNPADHQQCVEAATATYCIYEPFESYVDEWADAIGPVLDAAPPDASPTSPRVEQRLSPEEIGTLDPRVRARLEPAALGAAPHAWPIDDGLHPDLRLGSESHITLAISAGSWVVGLPASGDGVHPCYAGGQSRGVVALWLASRSIGDGASTSWFATSGHWYGDHNDYGNRPADLVDGHRRYTDLLPADYETNAGPTVVWDDTDLALTRALLDDPADEVRATLHDEWTTVTDPETTTAELAARFGLEAGEPGPGPEGVPVCS